MDNTTKRPPKNNNKLSQIIIVCAICVLIVVVCATILIISLKDNDKEDTASTEETSTTQTVKTQTPTEETEVSTVATEPPTAKPTEAETLSAQIDYATPTLDYATYFSNASASSVLPDQLQYNYSANNVLIYDDSCWCENSSNTGTGEWIKLDLPEKQLLSGLQIVNGYAGTPKQYTYNGKLKDIRLEFSDGQSLTTTLNVFDVSNRNTIQYVEFNTPVATSYVKIIIESVVEGDCKDTCLTYVAPY